MLLMEKKDPAKRLPWSQIQNAFDQAVTGSLPGTGNKIVRYIILWNVTLLSLFSRSTEESCLNGICTSFRHKDGGRYGAMISRYSRG